MLLNRLCSGHDSSFFSQDCIINGFEVDLYKKAWENVLFLQELVHLWWHSVEINQFCFKIPHQHKMLVWHKPDSMIEMDLDPKVVNILLFVH